VTASSAFVFPRDRLFARLDGALRASLVLVIASHGSGKSTAVREYLAAREIDAVWIDLAAGQARPAAFVHALARAFGERVPAMRSSATVAAQRLAAGEDQAPVVAWACEHLSGVEMTVVLDNVQALNDAPDAAALVRDLIDATMPHLRWVLIGSDAASFPVAGWLANSVTDLPIDDEDLRVDVTELRQAVEAAGVRMSDTALARLHRASGGWPLGLSFALTRGSFDESLTPATLYDGLVDAALAGRDDAARRVFYATALLGRFEGTTLTGLVGDPDATVRELLQLGFIYAVGASAYAYFEPYRERISARFFEEPSERSAVLFDAVAIILEREGRWADAIALRLRSGDTAAIARSLDARGFRALDLGEVGPARDALAVVPDEEIIGHPIALGMKAVLASLDERFDLAEAWFRMAIDAAEGEVRRQIVLRYGIDLVRRDRADVVEVLEEEAARSDDRDDTAALWALLGTAYVSQHRADDARTAAERALTRLGRVRDEGLRSRILHQTAYVALSAGDYVSARDLATRALAAAEAAYEYDVAARACSVLFNVAYLADDDVPAGRRALAKLDEAGRKAGSPALRVYATINAYALEVDAGDVTAIERLDEELRRLQIFLTQITSESLLPAQALRAAWDGGFEHAYELLAPSADKLFDDDRNAYRWAEIAVYAAAAGKRSESAHAIRRSREIMRRTDPADRLALRGRAYLAIAEILLAHDGRARSAIADLRGQARKAGPRFGALVDAVRALYARWTTGWHGDPSLADAFEGLERHDLGGVGRFLGALPLPLTDRARIGLLSDTEKAVLGMIAGGATSKEIAADLGRSSQTIDVHVRSICKKLGCSGRRQAVAFALREGLIDERRRAARSSLR
jgi:LuxR family transcriptional regulator, maltose regulon positive regulatory protein